MLTHRATSLASSQLFLWHQFSEPNYCHGLAGLQHRTVSTRQSYLRLLGPRQFCWAGHTAGNAALQGVCGPSGKQRQGLPSGAGHPLCTSEQSSSSYLPTGRGDILSTPNGAAELPQGPVRDGIP